MNKLSVKHQGNHKVQLQVVESQFPMINISPHPVVHLQLCSRSQADGPPLFGSLCCIDGKCVFGVIQYWHQDCHIVNEHVEILAREKCRKIEVEFRPHETLQAQIYFRCLYTLPFTSLMFLKKVSHAHQGLHLFDHIYFDNFLFLTKIQKQ